MAPAVSYSATENVKTAATCQGAPQYVRQKMSRKVSQSVSSIAPDNGNGADRMYSDTSRKFFGPDEHRARIAAALRRRLYPNTILHGKQLAHAIGVSPDTISNWRRGYCDPGSYEIGCLYRFFAEVEGGPGFWTDVFGPIGEQMMRRAAE